MNNLLTDPLIQIRRKDGEKCFRSIPEIYQELKEDNIVSFLGLQPHQRHAWHAFLAQLGVVALTASGQSEIPKTSKNWYQLLSNLTNLDYPNEEPWQLVVDDFELPAFMQCPIPDRDAKLKQISTPDDIDILVKSKNHDVKQSIAVQNSNEDWIFALISLQTMSGFLGSGNYGISRMNGGFSSRPCLGLMPADGYVGAHIFSDIKRMLIYREKLLDDYSEYYQPENGLALLWVQPWDGAEQLSLRQLDPFFIEICRRIRLCSDDNKITARTMSSKSTRVFAKEANGNLGDFWTPVQIDENKAYSITSAGFRYNQLVRILFEKKYLLPPSMQIEGNTSSKWRFIARGVAGGQGKTEGYHERKDIAFTRETTHALMRSKGRDLLAEISKCQIAEISEVAKALKLAINVYASGGKEAAEFSKSDREKAGPYIRRFDEFADSLFFSYLDDRFNSTDETEAGQFRFNFLQSLIENAKQLLNQALKTSPCLSISQHKARAKSESAFRGYLRRKNGEFADEPDLLKRI